MYVLVVCTFYMYRLYVYVLVSISQVVNRTKGYTLWHDGERNTMSHLLYMDDLKIYSGGPDKLREAIECVEKTSNAIGMRFEVRKCGTAHMQKGRLWLAQTTLNAVKNPQGALKKVLPIST